MSDDTIQVNGIKVESLILIASENSKKLDINEIVAEFNIFESMDQPYMTMDIVLVDALALTTIMPIIGSEKIQVKFQVPVSGMKDKPFEKTFRVLKILEFAVDDKARQSSYILKCYDEEYFHEITTQVQRSYSEKTTSEIVKEICKEYLKMSDSTLQKKFFSSETEGKLTVVVPSLSPATTIISLLARQAKSKKYGEISNYKFWSSQDGFHFQSVEDMIDEESRPGIKVDKFTLKEKNLNISATTEAKSDTTPGNTKSHNTPATSSDTTGASTADTTPSSKPGEWLRINRLTFVNKVDMESAIRNGMVDSTLYHINPTIRSFQKRVYNYIDDFSKFKHVASQKGHHVFETKSGELKKLKGESYNIYMITNKGTQNINEDVEDKRYSFGHYRIASESMMDSVILDLTVPGDNTRKVGDIVDLQLPEYGATDDIIGKVDKFISGKYLVTAVRHIYNVVQGYTVVMRCQKNCFESSFDEVKSENFSHSTPKDNSTKVETNTPSTTPSSTNTTTGTGTSR